MTDESQTTAPVGGDVRIELPGGFWLEHNGLSLNRRYWLNHSERGALFHIDIGRCQPEFDEFIAALTPAPPEPPARMAEVEQLVDEHADADGARAMLALRAAINPRYEEDAADASKDAASTRDALLSAVRSILTRAETAEVALASLCADREATEEWQPIETAPRDGTSVDLWAKREKTSEWSRYTDCRWGQPRWGTEPIGDKKWLGLNDQYSIVTPTHWRPLPKPPYDLTTEPRNG